MRLRVRLIVAGIVMVFIFGCVIKMLSNGLDESETLANGGNSRVFESETDQINLNELFYFGGCLLREAGKRIVQIRSETDMKLKHKKDESVVTRADLESHTIIVHALENKFKRLRVYSEENGAATTENFDLAHFMRKCDYYEAQSNDIYTSIENIQVWIDPLDATQEYSENLVDYVTVMFCIVDKNKPKAGIIYNPFENKTLSTFYSKANLGDTVNTSRKNRVIISRSHAGSVNSTIYAKIKDPNVIIAGGSGYKTMSLLDNKADVYLHTSKIYKWDICAPNAILNNFGGRLTKLNGRNVDYSDTRKESMSVDGIIAAVYNYNYFLEVFKKI